MIEANLVKAWKALMSRYLQHAEKPFSVDPETLQREDHPPDYVAFREAAINLLIHQDYADQTRKPSIRFFDDRTLLWNPGDTFASAEELLDPGEKEVRNPRIVAAFRRIGLSEQAGTGIRAIFDRWRKLGRVPPIVDNDKARKAFQLTLLKEELLSKEQLLFQASLGVRLDEAEARSFAFACREGRLRPRDVRAVTGLSGAGVQAILEHLVVQALIWPLEGTGAPVFAVIGHFARRLGRVGRSSTGQPDMVTDQADAPVERLVTDQADAPAERLVTDQADAPAERLVTDQADAPAERLVTDQADAPVERLVTDQVGSDAPDLSSAQAAPLTELSPVQWKIVAHCDIPRTMAEVMGELGLSHRAFFRRAHLDPLLWGGVLRMTHPDRPNHPHQAYVLTEAGAALKARRTGAGARMRSGG